MMPPPPPGFTEDVQLNSGAIPPPPAGFTEDVNPNQGGYWSDVRRNAKEGLSEIPGAALSMVDKGNKILRMSAPLAIQKSLFQAVRGEPTDIGEGITAVRDLGVGTAKGLWDTVKTVGKTAAAPVQMAMGSDLKDTAIGKQFRERPLSTTANIVSAAIPAAKLFRARAAGAGLAGAAEAAADIPPEGPAAEAVASPKSPTIPEAPQSLPNYLETKGGQGLYGTTGIRGLTVQKIAKSGENPGAVGTRLISDISDQGGIGTTSAETWDKMNRLHKAAGKAVGDSLKAIGEESNRYGAVDNPLAMDAEIALKPLYEGWVEREGGATAARRAMAAPYEDVHGWLTDMAEKQGGKITTDNIKAMMDEIGPMTHKGNPEMQEAMSELYGTLADTHDHMIQELARQAKNPALRTNLLKANANYSRLTRVMPDVSRAAAMESVGQPNLGGLIHHFKQAILQRPELSKGILKMGKAIKPKPILRKP